MVHSIWGRRLLYVVSALFWAVLVGTSLIYNLSLLDRQASDNALARARMLFRVIETTRLWNAERGGVYAAMDAHTPSNPYLSDPERDVLINGRPFTKVNPAYMTRQLAELIQRDAGVVFNITSLKPINPANQADAWETVALKSFEKGRREVIEQIDAEDGQRFRYMAALVTQSACLSCHAAQGYRIGDIRGGISVTIPGTYVLSEIAPQKRQTVVFHLTAFLALSALSLFFLHRIERNWLALERMVDERTSELRAESEERRRVGEKLQETVQELERIALYDDLTGLCSRTLFQERILRALERADRRGSLVSLTFIDLNGFKPINDTYGHRAGDAVLQATAQRMQAAVRRVDTVARLGGDEFVIVMEDLDARDGCVRAVERMLEQIAQPVTVAEGIEVVVHASAGTAFYPDDADTADSLVAIADAAMYRAKGEQHAAPAECRHVVVDSDLILVPMASG